MSHKILAVDFEANFLDICRMKFREAGFEIATAYDEETILAKAQTEKPSLILLDLTERQTLGLDLCEKLKRESLTTAIPIILCAPVSSEQDRIAGFEAGADDYVTKPYGWRELLLRAKKSIHRHKTNSPGDKKTVLGPIVMDQVRHQVTILGRLVPFTSTEYKLLSKFIDNCGKVLERETLLEIVWGQNSDTNTRTIDTHLARLRYKLGSLAPYLETVRGLGYRLSDNITSSSKAKITSLPESGKMDLYFERRQSVWSEGFLHKQIGADLVLR